MAETQNMDYSKGCACPKCKKEGKYQEIKLFLTPNTPSTDKWEAKCPKHGQLDAVVVKA